MRLKIHDGFGFGRTLVVVGKGEAAKWGREKLQPLAPEQGQILWPCYEVGQRQQRQRERGSAPEGWEHGRRGAERGARGALGPAVPAGGGCWAAGRRRGGFQLPTQSVGELGLLPVKLKIAHV